MFWGSSLRALPLGWFGMPKIIAAQDKHGCTAWYCATRVDDLEGMGVSERSMQVVVTSDWPFFRYQLHLRSWAISRLILVMLWLCLACSHTQICHGNPSKAAEESGNTDTVKVLKAGGCVVVCPCQIHIKKTGDSDSPMLIGGHIRTDCQGIYNDGGMLWLWHTKMEQLWETWGCNLQFSIKDEDITRCQRK